MIPRKRLDIGWTDLFWGFAACLWPGGRERMRQRLERLWSPEGCLGGKGLACLSVRSGFDALLSELDLPRGSEVLVSAITIRDMTRILEEHGLVPVPVDLDMRTLAVDPESLARAVTPRSRAILVAHLFGSRMPLEPVLSAAREHGLFVIEDCAQAYCGDNYRGHPECDVSLFSFGPIKTATALAGGLLTFRDRSLRDRVGERQAGWPVQGRGRFLTRIVKYSLLKLLSYRPVFSLFYQGCRMAGASHDAIIGGSVRSFSGTGAGAGFFGRIRQRPSFPLLALLARRLTGCNPGGIGRGIEERAALARLAIGLMPAVERPGDQAPWHTHWVFPIQEDEPEMLIPFLWTRGFDATRGASSLCVVDPPEDRPETEPSKARQAFSRLLYLPVHPGLRRRDVERLARAVLSGLSGRRPER